jgi:hypothetical protein
MIMTTFEECSAKKKKWRKAFLTLGFSLTSVWVFGKSVKSAAEEHVPDYTEDYLVNGEKVRVGYYDPDKDHTAMRFIWRIIYVCLFLAIQIVMIMPVALILWIYYGIKEHSLKKAAMLSLFVLPGLSYASAQQVFYAKSVQNIYYSLPETCTIADTAMTNMVVLCPYVVQGDTVPLIFRWDENRVLDHIGYPFLQTDDSLPFNNNVIHRFIERELLSLLLTNDINQTFVSYRENSVSVLLNDKPLKQTEIRNKRGFLNLLKTVQGIAVDYDGKKYNASLLFENEQKLSFSFPADAELLTGMNKEERDICLVVQLKNHKAKSDSTVMPDYSYLQSLGDSVYVDKGSSFMIPQINNDIFYTKIDSTYSLVFDSCLVAETFANALVVSANMEYTINITQRMYGNQKKQYTVSSRNFDDFFSRGYDRYFGIKTTEEGKLTGTLILSDRNAGCIHLASVSVSLDDLLKGGTMEMQLYSNIPTHNLKTLFGK